ncbi:FUSC family protein [Gordonia sp. HY002]|uniref:FUSC family protein n=1 Tax=Gordonia zhenghanii TaxID=2911516 RepID=UPI001EF12F8E|nr:FUSC family protein [Gordonia zhenghanii]MCF8571958.1 FUSC family protein [Gordonia zhenghanii]MCF8604176.1 FUSC family protein [Gordonia zhenghanii]
MLSLPANPLRTFAGTDPGLVRLSNAIAVATTVLLSTESALGITRLTHSSSHLVLVGTFLAMISGLSVKDATAAKRLTTTILLMFPAVAVLSAITLLHRWRFFEIAVLIAVCTAATWVRRFGPRWTALGMIAFITGFFGLIISPNTDELRTLVLIVVAATACNVAVKLVMLPAFPRRELRLLLREFRAACSAGLAAATSGSEIGLQRAIDRIGDVAIAITDWQGRYDTERRVGITHAELARLVFDARTDAVQVSVQVAADPTATHLDVLDAFRRTLRTDTAPDDARRVAEKALESPDSGFVSAVAARAVVSQIELQNAVATRRRQSPTHRRSHDTSSTRTATLDQHKTALAHQSSPAPHRTTTAPTRRHFWDTWEPTSRMAVQVAIATTLATVVGEAISASRWYWAVLTAFLVFVGTATRGAVLTRALRRVLGTALGVVVGVAATWVADGHPTVLTLYCVVSVFFMIYLGSLNYAIVAFFVTTLLVSMYGLLGVLDRQVLEWRVEETAAGALVGVAAAFLVVSTSSRPQLIAAISSYFDALDGLLQRTGQALTGTGDTESVVAAANALDAERDALQTFVSLMWVSLADHEMARLRRSATAVIDTVGVQVEQLAEQSVVLQRTSDTFAGDDAAAVSRDIDVIRAQAASAHAGLVTKPVDQHDPAAIVALDCVAGVPASGDSSHFRALLAMSGTSAAVQHLGRLRARA